MAQQNMNDPKQVLMVNRTIWAAMVMGVVAFGAVVFFLSSGASEPPAAQSPSMLFYVACALVLTAIPAGIFVRGQIFKRSWEGNVIKPQAYTQGNIIAWTSCEAPALVALVAMLLGETVMPNLLPAVAALVMMVLMFPNGKAMLPADDPGMISER